ncbi:NAD(P)-binding protein [Aspergillus heteromorphus CBS 117.55]|uniref:D-xylose 1-dehydrogenase (NADP(+), D-xylono-1,5-lactone-forming) n=1 Tax=Aspergillus heteromorphus CBS 117.55 TaxID=1448321 RepID=A0A317WA86_9EURO|nr:NAD(P)-binding protein [Aspergillus heteromorphus CBS 117.55]PWY83444.1 NAD(P)-binding protein [Aspergillus heteromorphus CBS 117.55]
MVLLDLVQRVYCAFNPPTPVKKNDAIRIGLLGASNIAPFSVINAAKSHSEVIVVAVAARDRERARQYAEKHDIPIVHDSYQALIDDPSVNAVYIALPNSLHYEWSLRSLKAGKHVLLEKPSCSNAEEARKLFNHPLVTAPNAPVILEAFHYQFHPAWQTFLSQVHQSPYGGAVKHVSSSFYLPKSYLTLDDIRFKYGMAGGCLMDLGTYPLSCVRQVLGREVRLHPVTAQHKPLPPAADGSAREPQIDAGVSATYRTDKGQTAQIDGDLLRGGGWSLSPLSWAKGLGLEWPVTHATLEEALVDSQDDGAQHFVQRNVTLWNQMLPWFYHRIDVCDTHVLRRQGRDVKTWKETKYLKAYNWPAGDERANVYRDWWTTYRCQLEEFVNRIKVRKGSGVWVDGNESIAQMEAIDATYAQLGLKSRPTTAVEI